MAQDYSSLGLGSLIGIALVVLAIYGYRQINALRNRKRLNPENVTELMVQDGRLKLTELMRIYHVGTRLKLMASEPFGLSLWLGKEGSLHLELMKRGGTYVLSLISHYRGMNWQFSGWYDEYVLPTKCENSQFQVKVEGDSFKMPRGDKRMVPDFWMTKAAVQQLYEEFRYGVK